MKRLDLAIEIRPRVLPWRRQMHILDALGEFRKDADGFLHGLPGFVIQKIEEWRPGDAQTNRIDWLP